MLSFLRKIKYALVSLIFHQFQYCFHHWNFFLLEIYRENFFSKTSFQDGRQKKNHRRAKLWKQKVSKIIQVTVPIFFYFCQISMLRELKRKSGRKDFEVISNCFRSWIYFLHHFKSKLYKMYTLYKMFKLYINHNYNKQRVHMQKIMTIGQKT